MPAVASSLEQIRTQRLPRSLAMRSKSVQIVVSETRTQLGGAFELGHDIAELLLEV
jgi:hypothetical protein